ncbi:hypothetical protein L226DRAFT_608344 [Lentinus tigrinus ALCF2SS1-7]|nr:hypothetical protein L226DRAFT_608344 [Lentinus tigrinus ALCF2SS1-7]
MPGLIFSRSQSITSQTTGEQTEDYVEDSEPEREERRLREKSRRKKSRSIVRPQPLVEVIELSDSGTSSPSVTHPSPEKTSAKPLIIVDVSDASDHLPSPEKPHKHEDASNHGDALFSDTSEDTTFDETLPSIRKILGLPKVPSPPAISQDILPKTAVEKAPEARPPLISNREPLSSPATAEESDEEDQGPLKLARFAYADPNALRRTASKTPSSSERDSSTPEIARVPGKAKRIPTPPSHAFAQDFTDAELSRIRKCVSCETSWTVRKSLANKMKHIEVCARKKKLTHETIRVLMRKELDSLPPVASTSKLPSTEPAPQVPETLLEEAVKDVQKKKAGRRPQVLQTVKSVEETRSNILDRARLLLQDTRNTGSSAAAMSGAASPPDVEMLPATQVFGMSNIAARKPQTEVPSADTTQVFGQSRLGLAQISRIPDQAGIVRTGVDIAANSDVSPLTQVFSTSVLGAEVSSPEFASAGSDEPPPATQVFAPSNLTNARSVTEALVTTNDDPLDEPISLHDTSEDDDRGRSSPRPIIISSSPSSNANHLPRSFSPTSPGKNAEPSLAGIPFARTSSPARLRRSPSPTGEEEEDPGHDVQDDRYNEQDWNNWTDGYWDPGDGACLHYIPDENGAGPSNTSPSRVQVQAPAPAPRRLGTILEDLPISGNNVGERGPVPEPPKKRTRRKKAISTEDDDADAQATVGKDISQEDLNTKLKEAILKDTTLHLRVLRYEPIHFDVFMKLATDLGIPAKRSGLKGKVRTFLDQKAIHFYGAEPSKSRTKRTRHP